MDRGGRAEFISWHPGRREKGTLALGSSMLPFIPLGPPTHGIVPPTLWVSILLAILSGSAPSPISSMTANPANLTIKTDNHKY